MTAFYLMLSHYLSAEEKQYMWLAAASCWQKDSLFQLKFESQPQIPALNPCSFRQKQGEVLSAGFDVQNSLDLCL